MRRLTPESAYLRAILDYFMVTHILAYRMNTGAHVVTNEYGNRRTIRYGSPGMADIIAFPYQHVLWVEVKAERGKQSEYQKAFQNTVEEVGHTYLLARSIDDVERCIKQIISKRK
jgi:hypothetical protein